MLRFLLLAVCSLLLLKATQSLAEDPGARAQHHGFRRSLLLFGGQVSDSTAASQDAAKNRYPYMASIRVSSSPTSSHACGGVLISDELILTAAHCFTDAGAVFPDGNLSVAVLVGAHDFADENDPDVEVRQGSRAILHPQWNRQFADGFDLGILRLDKPSNKEPIHLPEPDKKLGQETTDLLTILGWGQIGDGRNKQRRTVLQAASAIMIIDGDVCNKTLNGILKDGMICAFGEGAQSICRGDSGGPLVKPSENDESSEDILMGIVSFGSSSGCGTRELPVVFSYMPFHMEFVEGAFASFGQSVDRSSAAENGERSPSPRSASSSRGRRPPRSPSSSPSSTRQRPSSPAVSPSPQPKPTRRNKGMKKTKGKDEEEPEVVTRDAVAEEVAAAIEDFFSPSPGP